MGVPAKCNGPTVLNGVTSACESVASVLVEKGRDVFGCGLRTVFRDIPDVRAIVTTEIVDMSL